VIFETVAVVKELMKQTRTGLQVDVQIDETKYAKGRKVSDEVNASLQVVRDEQLPKFNYQIRPTCRAA
jgi:uncharacterized protein YqfA (UPF0365 family)